MLISVSCLMAKNTKSFINEINDSMADFVHIDIMDGRFVNNRTYELSEVEKIKQLTNKPLDIHLMVEDVVASILVYRTVNPAYLTFHLEAVSSPRDMIDLIKSFGIKAGISIKPQTDINLVIQYLKDIDQILVMSVEPGMGGQEFIKDTITRIATLKNYIFEKGLDTIVSVDGGINAKVIKAMESKPDMVVMGSAITSSPNPIELINQIKKD